MEPLGGAEFAPDATYLNTSSCGLLPRRAITAVQRLAESNATGRQGEGAGSLESLAAVRASFARLAGVPAERVALGGCVSVHVGLIAASLEPGAEVLLPEGEFSSVVTPFAVRGDLRLRYVPLEKLADEVRPDTALVAFSAVQSADGRLADLTGVRAAAEAHGARTLLDASQSAGWLPLDAGAYDYTVTGAFKYLLCPRGASFLTVTEDAQESLRPIHAGWLTGEDLWGSNYGAVSPLTSTARRYDEAPSFLAYHGAEQSLALVEELGIDPLHTRATTLAARFRAGLTSLGLEPVPVSGPSAIVSVPGLEHRADDLRRAEVYISLRAGNVRASFHLYNTTADVDRALDVLAG
ncbi:aminotransferase class V-fold PLP-dependent enzyme [Streptomyces paludis]|uniref:Aminotransferase class V-fold PLP-dependent enzyme n=1 Tax=Streptomyces paludis TaxID=2282738 RepID=A0A345HKH8_9ACTN|nr:aminotransferase class V-fold PLP-dependent enzyme [Streptomyces paludis]AXG77202.1 aminotransferase class V-fold PLP-dependent enzyme [Streptomyces paludis]